MITILQHAVWVALFTFISWQQRFNFIVFGKTCNDAYECAYSNVISENTSDVNVYCNGFYSCADSRVIQHTGILPHVVYLPNIIKTI